MYRTLEKFDDVISGSLIGMILSILTHDVAFPVLNTFF